MMKQTFKDTISLIRADMQMRCHYENKDLNALQLLKFLVHAGANSCILYRLQIFFYTHHCGLLASLCKAFNSVVFTVDIDSKSEIGPGFFPIHRSYIVIGPNVKIGRNCMMAHQNVVSASPFYQAGAVASQHGPVIGDNVIMGGGSCVTGSINIGNNVHISMNASVEKSFPDDVVLFGVPAKAVSKLTPSKHLEE